jgi:hypothetical protein
MLCILGLRFAILLVNNHVNGQRTSRDKEFS